MNRTTFSILGILVIINTIILDILFATDSLIPFTIGSAFMLGVLTMLAYRLVRMIFLFEIDTLPFTFILPTLAVGRDHAKGRRETSIGLFNKSLTISLKKP